MNSWLAKPNSSTSPDDTTIGTAVPGFDLLGYSFYPAGYGLAQKVIREHRIEL